MSPIWGVLAFALALTLGWIRGRRAIRDAELRTVRPNYAGRDVPVVLGPPLVESANAALALALTLAVLAGPVASWPVPVLVGLGGYVLHLVGRVDDRSGEGPRGLRAHVERGLRGRPTTGVWKLVAGVVVAVAVSVGIGGGPVRVAVAAVVIALSINVTNALDVRPGRAIKWALALLLPLSLWLHVRGLGAGLAVDAYLGAAAAVGPLDLEERGMIGDAGSNPLGLVAGSALAASMPVAGLLVALAALAALQVAAETVTISSLIERAPPLRWLDRLGRRN